MKSNTKERLPGDLLDDVPSRSILPPGQDEREIDEVLIERIRLELDELVTRERIRLVVEEVAASFDQATVEQFVPILIHREAVERLKEYCDEAADSTEEDSKDRDM